MSTHDVPFTDLLEKIIDNRGRTAPTTEFGLPLIATNCIKDDSLYPVFEKVRYVDQSTYQSWFRGHPEPGDIVFVCKGSPGRVALTPDPVSFCIAQDMVAVRPDPKQIYPKYLFAALRSNVVRHRIDNMHVGTLIPHFKKGDFSSLLIPLVPDTEQRFIGDLYFQLSDLIESNRRASKSALAAARAQTDRATTGKPLVSYLEAMKVRMGSAFKGNSFCEPGVGRPLLRIRDLKTFESQTWTTEVRKDETVVRPGDIVVGMDAEFRATLWLGAESVLNQRVCSFEGRSAVGRAFILASLEPELARQEQGKSGTTVIHLNKADIDSFSVPELTEREHRDLSTVTEPLIDYAVARSIENRKLASTRDTLLPELMSGRIQVPESSLALQETIP